MKKNMGSLDRIIRIVAALAIGVLILTGTFAGLTATILGILAGVLVLTSSVSFCPLYALLSFSTGRDERSQ